MIFRELSYIEPMDAALRLRSRPGFAFLDSGGSEDEPGRYSFIGVSPFARFTIAEGAAFWNGDRLPGVPLAEFSRKLAEYRTARLPDGPPLQAGCIGHIAYELGHLLERLDRPEPSRPRMADLCFRFHDLIYAFDRRDRRLWIHSSGLPETGPAARAERARTRLQDGLAWLDGPPAPAGPFVPVSDWFSNFDAQSYGAAVESVREHIRSGDIYQANISQRFQAPLPSGFDPWALYQRLREVNPAPFSAYLSDGDISVLSSSPERFLSLRDGLVEARPIKGTIGRSPDPRRDRALAETLSGSEKDRAENIMIVDLLRNDLSRACRPGSVEVPVLCGLESYASVHHLTSVVRGRLRQGLDAVDLIAACFPGGSITGAPKVSAMNIITGLERHARGIYCGAIGYIGFDGDMDLNIAIRTATTGDGIAVFQAGGGVTLMSEGAAEYAETLTKAQRIFDAFAGAGPDESQKSGAASGASDLGHDGPCC